MLSAVGKGAVMVRINLIHEDDAHDIMNNREFPDDLLGSSQNVAVILSQSWCPQWTIMKNYMDQPDAFEEVDITVYYFLYDNASFYDEFMDFKEKHFNNYQIPYVRYYKDGKLVGESNYVWVDTFIGFFE